MSHPFRTLHHICIVVHDLAKSVAYYEKLGIGPWFDYPKGAPYVTLDVPSEAATAAMRYQCANLDNAQLQLCEPPKIDCPQRRFLDDYGEGVYHLGFEVAALDDAEAAVGRAQVSAISRGRRADGSGFTYFDTRAGAGVTLEIRTTASPPDRTT